MSSSLQLQINKATNEIWISFFFNLSIYVNSKQKPETAPLYLTEEI